MAAPAAGARQARRPRGVHADGGRDARGTGTRSSPATSCCSSCWSRSRTCRRRTSRSGWSSRCRSWSSPRCCRSWRPDPQVEVLGLSLSEQGLLGAWGLLVKGTLGVLASLLLAATTEPRALLAGLERLRMPPLLVQIMGFMIRYLDVVTDELRRMHVARESRGFSARDPRQWPVIAKSAGVLFIRSYERGERVHLAMLSRGYDGRMPEIDERPRPRPPGRRLRLPRRPPGAARRRPARPPGRARRAARSRTAPARPRSCCTSTAS